DISLELAAGEVMGLIGPSGSGKSTLLRCVNFLETFEAGTLSVAGETVGYRVHEGRRIRKSASEINAMRARCAMVFQQYNLFLHMTALQNVAIAPIKVKREPREAAMARAAKLLDKVGLGHRKDAYPSALSGGEQQRVAIARALAMQPAALLLDEITSALDPERTGEVVEVVSGLAAEGMTMIIVTHQMEFAQRVCHRVAFLEGGELVETGGREIFDVPRTERLGRFLKSVAGH
ncbi:MAG: amino acid ABC transporter ATP-binding protein, partial [Rhodoferax sp.]